MGADKKPDRLTALARVLLFACIAAAGVLMALAYWAPELAARDVLSPRRLVFLPWLVRNAFVLLGIFALATLFTGLHIRALGVTLLATCAVGWFVSNPMALPKTENSRFLSTFSQRVRREVGVEVLDKFLASLSAQAASGQRTGAAIHYRELPPAVQSLFTSTSPRGDLLFTDATNICCLKILWGGPLFRWGIDVRRQTDQGHETPPALLREDLSTNIATFIAK